MTLIWLTMFIILLKRWRTIFIVTEPYWIRDGGLTPSVLASDLLGLWSFYHLLGDENSRLSRQLHFIVRRENIGVRKLVKSNYEIYLLSIWLRLKLCPPGILTWYSYLVGPPLPCNLDKGMRQKEPGYEWTRQS